MSLYQKDNSDNIKEDKLDLFLSNGWFRFAHSMYKAPIHCLNGGITSVINIRLDLKKHSLKKTHRRLLRKNDKKFRVTISPAVASEEANKLYQLSQYKFKGLIIPDLHDFLYGEENDNPFETLQIEIYHDEKLVAISFADVGKNSMASIIGLYHPDFSKHSLGIYTMLKEIEVAKNKKINWYYPGYILDGMECFNYKLTLGSFQAMQESGAWVEIDEIDFSLLLGRKMDQNIKLLNERIKSLIHQKTEIFYYPTFHLGYTPPHQDDDFLNKPIFIIISNYIYFEFIISYDLLNDRFSIEKIIDEPLFEIDTDNLNLQEYIDDVNCWLEPMRVESVGEFENIDKLISHLRKVA